MKLLYLALILAPSVLGMRQQRGLMDEAERFWDSLNHGIDHIQAQARNDFAKLKPWAQQMEEEIRPAMEKVEHHLGQAFDHMARNPVFGYNNVDRNDNTPIVAQDHHETEASDQQQQPSSGPTLHDLLMTQFGGSGQLNPFSIFGLSRRKNWWEGENVCVDRKVVEDEKQDQEDQEPEQKKQTGLGGNLGRVDMTMTSCKDGDSYHECTTHLNQNGKKKTVITTYQCCYGHKRKAGKVGCTEVEMISIDRTLNDLDGEEFLGLLESEGIMDLLKDNITIFMPTNEAVEDFRHDLEALNSVDSVSYSVDTGLVNRRKRSGELTVVETPQIKDILMNHIVPGFKDSSKLDDELVLDTMNADARLRITAYNTYPKKTIMANCAQVTSRDHFATSGLIHTVDKVILPATKTIADIITSDDQFTNLASILKKTELLDSLTKDGQFTLFAPSDKAIARLDKEMRDKLEAGNGCSKDIVNHHILPNVICSSVVESKAKTINALKKFVTVHRDEDDNLFVEGKQIIIRDIVGTNGVIHVIDEVIIPESARSYDDALGERGSDTFLELLELSGLNDDKDLLSNSTIFVPTEKAFESLPESFIQDIRSDKQKLQDFLLYHIATAKTCKCDFENNKELKSGFDGKKLRLNVYGRAPFSLLDLNPGQIATVQCAMLSKLDDEVCGGMIHTVDKVLLPPTGNTVEIIKTHGDFNKFLELIQFAELENEINTDGPYTILAPTDKAFEKLDTELYDKAFADKDVAADIVHHHVMPDMMCCSGISRSVPFFDLSGHRNSNGDIISLRRSRGGHLYAERSEITTCDMIAENGVVHALDRVMVPDHFEKDTQFDSSSESTRRKSPFYMFKIFK